MAELVAAGVTARVDGRSRLHLAGPLTDDLLLRVKAHKPELVQAVRLSRCDRCGSTDFIDTTIHAGQSTRRDCAKCRRTWGFPVWYGKSEQARLARVTRLLSGDLRGNIQPASEMVFSEQAARKADRKAGGCSDICIAPNETT